MSPLKTKLGELLRDRTDSVSNTSFTKELSCRQDICSVRK